MTKKTSLILIGLFVLLSNCAEVNYIGQTYQPTDEVEIFFDEKLIKYEYTIIGQALGTGYDNDKIQEELIKTARFRGAHAIIITGIGEDSSNNGDGASIDKTQINATFIRYDE